MGTEEVSSSYVAVASALALRVHVAEDALSQVASNPGNPLNIAGCELAALQLRLICELVLTGSQIAHIENAGAKLSDKKWRPVDAFAQIKDLSEHPLQVPVGIALNANGVGHHRIDPLSKPIPFVKLSEIYGRCGDFLHVPSIKQFTSNRLPEFDVGLAQSWVHGFKRLVQGHCLMLPRREKILLCTWNGDAGSKPDVHRLDAMGESTLDISALDEFGLF